MVALHIWYTHLKGKPKSLVGNFKFPSCKAKKKKKHYALASKYAKKDLFYILKELLYFQKSCSWIDTSLYTKCLGV